MRRLNPEFANDPRHLHVRQDGGEWFAFSWRKAIEQPSWEQQARRTMRQVCDELRLEFKWSQDAHVCHECGEKCKGKSLDEATVDETPPHKELTDSYVAAHGWPKFDNPPEAMGWVFADIDEEARFIAHVSARWTLRILCRSCNSSKGAGDAPKTTKEHRRQRAQERACKVKHPDMFA